MVKFEKRPPITWQLLILVNAPLAIALAVLLMFDYRREMRNSILERQSWLNEEAKTIYRGLFYLGDNDHVADLQRLLNSAATRSPASQSPLHHIAVRWNGGLIQSQTDHEASRELLAAIDRADGASDHLTLLDDETFVLGRFSNRAITVYVAELATSIRQATRSHILEHLGAVLLLAAMAAVIVNVALWRIVGRPIRRLSKSVRSIAEGNLTVAHERFSSRELDDLSAVIHSMSETLAANEETRRAQLSKARTIQENLLPKNIAIPGLTIAHRFRPAEDVAGDYYDFVPLNDGSWLICVADVTGHGIPAAIGAAILKAVLFDAAARPLVPGEILGRVNQRLFSLLPDQFISMIVARWQPGLPALEYASAGHEPAMFCRRDQVLQLLEATGPLLGICDDGEWETKQIKLAAQDRVLLATDGITEAASPSGKMFGRASLAALLCDCPELTHEQTMTAIEHALDEHRLGEPSRDDCTMLLLEIGNQWPPGGDHHDQHTSTVQPLAESQL